MYWMIAQARDFPDALMTHRDDPDLRCHDCLLWSPHFQVLTPPCATPVLTRRHSILLVGSIILGPFPDPVSTPTQTGSDQLVVYPQTSRIELKSRHPSCSRSTRFRRRRQSWSTASHKAAPPMWYCPLFPVHYMMLTSG